MADVIVWGTGKLAEVIAYYLESDSEHVVKAFCVDAEFKTCDSFQGKPVVAFEEIERRYPSEMYRMAVFISYRNINKIREEKYRQVKEKGYRCISYINSSSTCNASEIGENTFILSRNDIQPFSKIGSNVIIWSSNSIGHHTIIANNCFLASTKISGSSVVGRNTFLGTGSSIADNLQIGDYCVIGTGAVVTGTVKSGSILAVKQTAALPISSQDMEDVLR